MQILKFLSVAACALVAMAAIGTATPILGQQPHYLESLSELRTARDYIQSDPRQQYKDARHHAVDEINKAIAEIKHAAWDDGKNTQFAPPEQAAGNPWAPLHNAKHFLDAAHAHVAYGADLPQNNGLRERAMQHIEEAQRTLDGIIYYEGQR